jgi:hypothetical protein
MKVVDAEPHILSAAGERVAVGNAVELRGAGVEHGANILMILEDAELLAGSARCGRGNSKHRKSREAGKMTAGFGKHKNTFSRRKTITVYAGYEDIAFAAFCGDRGFSDCVRCRGGI